MTLTTALPEPAAALRESRIKTVPVLLHWAWSPLGLMLLLPLPALIAALTVPDSSYTELWGQPVFITGDIKLLAVVYATVIFGVFGVLHPLISSTSEIRFSPEQVRWVVIATRILATLTFAAYGAWLLIGVSRGMDFAIVADLLRGDSSAPYRLKEYYLDPVSGVTTWSQLGILVGPLVILRGKLTSMKPSPLVIALVLTAAARAVLFSERLAVLEVVVSAGLAWLIFRSKPPFFFKNAAAVVLSYVTLWISLIVFFGVFEYTRSWLHYYASRFDGGVADFAWQRLLGYYATAFNNAALQGQVAQSDFTLAYILQGDLYRTLLGPAAEDANRFANSLQSLSNPEFSNVSGLLVPGNAFGAIGGLVFWVVVAAVIAIVVVMASRGRLIAILVYCSLGIGILEVDRLFYYGTSRFLPAILALIVLAVTWAVVSRRANEQQPDREAGSRQDANAG